MSVTVYGLPSCTTVRRSLKWLEGEGIDHDFVPFSQVDDLPAAIRRWMDAAGKDTVMNARAATFRALPEADQAAMQADTDTAVARMAEDPRLIKRPVLEAGDKVLPGFREDDWRAALS